MQCSACWIRTPSGRVTNELSWLIEWFIQVTHAGALEPQCALKLDAKPYYWNPVGSQLFTNSRLVVFSKQVLLRTWSMTGVGFRLKTGPTTGLLLSCIYGRNIHKIKWFFFLQNNVVCMPTQIFGESLVDHLRIIGESWDVYILELFAYNLGFILDSWRIYEILEFCICQDVPSSIQSCLFSNSNKISFKSRGGAPTWYTEMG